jgi:glyoxylase-like metal-dependent hydrolase (beta-lactamase superfamily II)
VSGLDVRMFTVGPVQENAYIVRAGSDASSAVIVDPGEEPQRLLEAAAQLGVRLEAILITHCHFDHVGAVAPLARATGAPVWCPEAERPVLADIMRWVPWEGFGPFESYEADHTVAGGERLSLAGVEFEVVFTPGHSPGHVTYAATPAQSSSASARPPATPEQPPATPATPAGQPPATPAPAGSTPPPALLSGDVLFQGSVGRTDLPGSDWNVLERSIGTLLERFPPESVVYPGHMGVTTLGREAQANPFLSELRAAAAARGASERGADAAPPVNVSPGGPALS